MIQRTGRWLVIVSLISILGVGTGCEFGKKIGAGKASAKVEVLAQVGSQKITTADFQSALANLPDDYRVLAESEKGKHKILENMVKTNLLIAEAERRGYQNDVAVKAKIKERKDKYRERLLEQIEAMQSRLATVDRKVYENVLLEEMNSHLKKDGSKDAKIGDNEIETYYQDYARKAKILNPSAKIPEMATVRPQIEAILVEEQLIKQLQKHTTVEVKEELFQKLYGSNATAIIEDGR